jgi:hypothetical protein
LATEFQAFLDRARSLCVTELRRGSFRHQEQRHEVLIRERSGQGEPLGGEFEVGRLITSPPVDQCKHV